MKLTKKESLEALCELCTKVMRERFQYAVPADCLCTEKGEGVHYEMSSEIIEFIQEAVDGKLIRSASKSAEEFYKEDREYDEDSWVEIKEDTDMENTANSLEESFKDFNLQDPATWYCFKEVAATLGEENAEYELGKVLRQINDGEITSNAWGYSDGLHLENDDLDSAFNWEYTIQGYEFWEAICEGIKPEGYDNTPDTPATPEVDKKATPTLKIPESVLGDIKETFTEELLETHSPTLGELVEAIQDNIPPHVGIHFQPDGKVLLECDNAFVVVSELDSEGIDKAIEFVAHYGHLVIGKNVEE